MNWGLSVPKDNVFKMQVAGIVCYMRTPCGLDVTEEIETFCLMREQPGRVRERRAGVSPFDVQSCPTSSCPPHLLIVSLCCSSSSCVLISGLDSKSSRRGEQWLRVRHRWKGELGHTASAGIRAGLGQRYLLLLFVSMVLT